MKYRYQLIHLPAVPYRTPDMKPEDDARTATDVLNEWGAKGWRVLQVVDMSALMERAETSADTKDAKEPPANAV